MATVSHAEASPDTRAMGSDGVDADAIDLSPGAAAPYPTAGPGTAGRQEDLLDTLLLPHLVRRS